ncbi:MAG: hypothetical protein GF364_17795 [Candidatus Lokiarchaeota archaeon]|nr:hypothetical protein [Candidatus Lokiarchaeota archaeon]
MAIALTGVIQLGSLDLPWNGIVILIVSILSFLGTGWWIGPIWRIYYNRELA